MTDRRATMAHAVLTDEWADAKLPPRRKRGSPRRRSTIGLPEWLWDDIDQLARLSDLSRDELVSLIIFKFFMERERRR